MSTLPPLTPDLQALVGLFYSESRDLGEFSEVQASAMPDDYRRLLDHNEHMTVTVEGFHGEKVAVQVLETKVDDHSYARKILLARTSDGRVVQFGIVRLNFSFLSADVRAEIEAQQTPLGRVLIEHDVMREVQLASLWQVRAGPDLAQMMGVQPRDVVYGRTAMIFCNGEPAVELLEIVSPTS